MSYQLTFAERFVYDATESGITVPTILTSGARSVHADAKIDTGSQFCIFAREIGERLGLDIESGLPKEMGTLVGQMTTFGHEVTLETFGFLFSTVVFFAQQRKLPRNLLGRAGWLQMIRLAVIDYDREIYLSLYDDPSA